ncbi:hypothetical protein HD883_003600 [Pigmentiphaga litoralis]|nr:hypothetical protein [Pigmentiphaga litoralis]
MAGRQDASPPFLSEIYFNEFRDALKHCVTSGHCAHWRRSSLRGAVVGVASFMNRLLR